MINLFQLHQGDCLESLRGMPDSSVDAVVTDPPYGLSFMGKKWDYDVPGVDVWAECLRVLKPGGHLLAFAGTRTQHRMAVRIEDAGFDIIDMIAWVHGQGFPKSMNLDRFMGEKFCGCAHSLQYSHENTSLKNMRGVQQTMGTKGPVSGEAKPDMRAGVRGCGPECCEAGEGPKTRACKAVHATYLPGLQHGVQPSECMGTEGEDTNLQPAMQRQAACLGADCKGVQACGPAGAESEVAGGKQPSMEGRCNASSPTRELCASSLCASPCLVSPNGPQGRLRDGAPAGDGAMVRLPADADGVRAPCGPRPTEQRERKSGAMAGQPEPQTVGAWPVCGGCGLPVVPRGLGTALKPALEPITMARKPLVGNVASNVLAHGTGALNIDGCRVLTDGEVREPITGRGGLPARHHEEQSRAPGTVAQPHELGRWPANLIHDGSDEVLVGFPDSGGSGPARKLNRSAGNRAGDWGMNANGADTAALRDAGTGSAARFFYCAKASKADRNSGLDSIVDVAIEWSQSLESNVWENEARKVQLLVDTEQLHPRVTGVFGARCNDATEWSTILFGSVPMAQSRMDSMCITKTKTSCTTPLGILSFCQSSITSASTRDALSGVASCGSLAGTAEQSILSITTTNDRMASALGVEHAASPMRLKISASAAKSGHPTVKPTDLMAYLCRLVTQPGGIILDPFMGSGSTGKAAIREGFRFIGCELSPEYLAIARARIEHELAKIEAAAAPAPQPDLFV